MNNSNNQNLILYFLDGGKTDSPATLYKNNLLKMVGYSIPGVSTYLTYQDFKENPNLMTGAMLGLSLLPTIGGSKVVQNILRKSRIQIAPQTYVTHTSGVSHMADTLKGKLFPSLAIGQPINWKQNSDTITYFLDPKILKRRGVKYFYGDGQTYVSKGKVNTLDPKTITSRKKALSDINPDYKYNEAVVLKTVPFKKAYAAYTENPDAAIKLETQGIRTNWMFGVPEGATYDVSKFAEYLLQSRKRFPKIESLKIKRNAKNLQSLENSMEDFMVIKKPSVQEMTIPST